jgi:hypothetical protein
MPKILAFLADKPRGATGREIADYLGIKPKLAGDHLSKLEKREQIQRDSGARIEAVWCLRSPVAVARESAVTPPVFRAMETLHVFQTSARAKLMKKEIA